VNPKTVRVVTNLIVMKVTYYDLQKVVVGAISTELISLYMSSFVCPGSDNNIEVSLK